MRRVHEVWKPVKGYEGLYKVSNQGRVRSLDRVIKCVKNNKEYERAVKGKILSLPDNVEYAIIHLWRDNKGENKLVHRLVAETFKGNPEGKPLVNHIDGDKHNNRASNLEWVTASENTQHAYDTGLIRKPRPRFYDYLY